MRLVRIENGAVAEYPFAWGRLRQLHPDVSFPRNATAMPEYDVFEVTETQVPSTAGMVPVEAGPVLVEGVWTQQWTEEAAPVPQVLTPLQARNALRLAGIKEAVDAYLSTLDDEDQEAWEYATEIRRDNEIIAAGAFALDMTEAQVDDLFRLGATL